MDGQFDDADEDLAFIAMMQARLNMEENQYTQPVEPEKATSIPVPQATEEEEEKYAQEEEEEYYEEGEDDYDDMEDSGFRSKHHSFELSIQIIFVFDFFVEF